MLMLICEFILQICDIKYKVYISNTQITMFLTKKTIAPKHQKKNNKALGGWEDEDINQAPSESKSNYSKFNEIQSSIHKNELNKKSRPSQQLDLLGQSNSNYQGVSFQILGHKTQVAKNSSEIKNTKGNQSQMFYDASALQQMSNIQCQCKAIQTVLSPGGIRLKQSDSILAQFLSEAKNLQIPIIGSLLICYLYNDSVDFQVKARSLYAIQHLAKKSIQYSVYFKLHIERIKNSPTCVDQQDSYNKIKKNLLVTLGDSFMKPEERKQVQQQLKKKQGLQYSDPGYAGGQTNLLSMINNEKEKGTKKLVSPAETKGKQKKVLTGPSCRKTENRVEKPNRNKADLLQLEGEQKKKGGQLDLLSEGNEFVEEKKEKKFDDLFTLQQDKKEPNDLNIFF